MIQIFEFTCQRPLANYVGTYSKLQVYKQEKFKVSFMKRLRELAFLSLQLADQF